MDLQVLGKLVDNHARHGRRFWLAFWAGFLLIPGALYAAYYYGVPERDVIAALAARFPAEPRQYTVYTGPEGGTYDRMAQAAARDMTEDEKAHWSLKLATTNGSLDNSVNVNTSRGAFAFVTESLIPGLYQAQGPALQSVAPLYVQKVFLAYRKARWKAFVAAECGGESSESLRLTHDTASCSYRFLTQARWDAGPLGGGGGVILAHLLKAARLHPTAVEHSATFAAQAKRLQAGQLAEQTRRPPAERLDVAFCFAGDYNAVFDTVRESLRGPADGALGMAGVDARLALAVNAINLRPNAFLDENGRQTETLGSYAVLVASPDVAPRDVAFLVRKLTPFVSGMTGKGTHLHNVADALDRKARLRTTHLAGVAGQLAVLMLTSALLCGTLVSALDSRENRRRIMQQHSRCLQRIRLYRETDQGPEQVLCALIAIAREVEATKSLVHELVVSGRLSLPHRDQLLASAGNVHVELKKEIGAGFAHVAADDEETAPHRPWLHRSGYLDGAVPALRGDSG